MAYPEDPGSDPESDPVRVRVCPDTKSDPPWPAGLVNRWVMPFSRQMRSNSTSAGRGLMNRPMKTVPLNIGQDFGGHAVDADGV